MAQQLMVQPHKSAVYLPASSSTGKEDMGERLPCAVWSVAEVRAIKEEVSVVQALRTMTLAPRTVSQVSVVIPTQRRGGMVLVEAGPGPLGFCPVQWVTEVEQDSQIWVANLRLHPVVNKVIAMAECVTETPGTCPEDEESGTDKVEGLVRRAAPHLNEEERQQLRAAMMARQQMQQERGTWDEPTLYNIKFLRAIIHRSSSGSTDIQRLREKRS